MTEDKITHFEVLNPLNVNEKTEKKSNGSIELTYLSWAWAWTEVKKNFPNAKYEILKFGENKLPYVFDEKTGYMVFTKVEIEGIEHEMWLPVMDSANKAMKDKPYNYKVKSYDKTNKQWTTVEKTVKEATMFDINKTIMRCLTKNLAMFGLGLYIYAGEDLPEDIEDNESITEGKESKKVTSKSTVKTADKKVIPIQDSQKQLIKDNFTKEEILNYLTEIKKSKLSELTIQEASELLKRAKGEEK